MSLNVYLELSGSRKSQEGSGIFIRENGQTKEITREEWSRRFSDRQPVIWHSKEANEVYSANITHNLGQMAAAAGIYEYLWRPDEIGITKAAQLIEPLRQGLLNLKSNPVYFKKFDAPNGWGTYKQFVPWVEEYLRACEENLGASVRVWR